MVKLHHSPTSWMSHLGLGGAVAVAGTVITAVAYGLVPITSGSVLGSYNATELISQFSSIRTLVGLNFVPLALLVMAGGGLWLMLRKWATLWRFGVAVVILAAAGFTVFAYLLPYSTLNSQFNESVTGVSPISLSGPGLWLALIGALIAAAGAVLELRTSSKTARPHDE